MVTTKQDIINIILQNEKQIEGFGILKIGLFGSFVKNMQTEKSDIDFFVEFDKEKKNFKNYINLTYLLEELMDRRIELITYQSLKPFMREKILKEVEYVI